MRILRRLLDKAEPAFHEGGALKAFYPLYEAIDTILYTPGSVTRTASHVRDGLDQKRMMVLVVVALVLELAGLELGHPREHALVLDAQRGGVGEVGEGGGALR